MKSKKAKPTTRRRQHTTEFKREAVRLLEARGERTVADVAASIGVRENLLHNWRRQFGDAADAVRRERGGETADDELKRLRRENAQLRQERELLKNDLPPRVSCWTRNSRGGSVSPLWKSDRQLFGAA